MKDWGFTSLGEICDFEGGSQPPKSQFIFEQRDGYIRFLQIRDFKSDKNVTFIKHSKKNRNCAESDIMIGRYGASVGQILTGKAGAYNVALMKTIPDLTRIDRRFFFHYLNSAEFQTRLAKVADRSAQNGFSKEDIAPFPVPVPSLPEQRRIVAVLDEAFEGLAIASTNTEKNLKNAREVFVSYFKGLLPNSNSEHTLETTVAEIAAPKKGSIRTGPFGSQLLHSEFVDDGIAVLGIDNAVANEFRWGKSRFIPPEKFEQLKRYRVFPDDVLITIMGTCGRCAIVPKDIPLAINSKHICCITLDQNKCLPGYLHAYFLYHPVAQSFLTKKAKGSIMAGLNMGLISELPVVLPTLDRQLHILDDFVRLRGQTEELESIYTQKLSSIAELKQSLLQKAFAGELTKDFRPSVVASSANSRVSNLSTADLHAGVLAVAYDRHHRRDKHKTFGRVKAQKFLHLVESVGRIDLGRAPIKDAAGPNDFQHMLRAEEWAKQNEFFDFAQRASGNGYEFKKLARFDERLKQANAALEPFRADLNKVIDLIIDMNSEEAELFATVHAAWTNLIIDGKPISDATIVREARENWHPDKLRISEQSFHNALNSIRTRKLEPDGTAKYVGGQTRLI